MLSEQPELKKVKAENFEALFEELNPRKPDPDDPIIDASFVDTDKERRVYFFIMPKPNEKLHVFFQSLDFTEPFILSERDVIDIANLYSILPSKIDEYLNIGTNAESDLNKVAELTSILRSKINEYLNIGTNAESDLNKVAELTSILRSKINEYLNIGTRAESDLNKVAALKTILDIAVYLSEKKHNSIVIHAHFRHCTFKSLTVKGAIVPKSISLSIENSSISEKVEIDSCNFKDSTWSNVNMDTARFKTRYSDFSKLKCFVTRFPKKFDKKGKDNLNYTKSAYAQLKQVADKKKDIALSMHYHAAYLDAHYYTISWWDTISWWNTITRWWNTITRWWNTIRWWGSSFSEKCSLGFLKYSTNFNRSWLRGVGVFMVLAPISYLFVLVATDEITWCNIWNRCYLEDFFSFINPISINFSEWKIAQSPLLIQSDAWVLAVLYLTKILVLMMYWQIIQSFRKFRFS